MLQIVICDDNAQYLETVTNTIEKILSQHNINGKILLKTTNPEEVEDYIKHKPANTFFLDIDLKSSINGYTLAKKIRTQNVQAYIVFLTGHFEYVLQAFKVQSFDFLVKPSTDEILEECVLRIYQNYLALTQQKDSTVEFLEVKSGTSIYKLRTSDIVYIERLKPKTILYTTSGEISCHESLESIESKLGNKNFIRCHKSFIANKSYICEIQTKERIIIFETGHQCLIGRKYKNDLCD